MMPSASGERSRVVRLMPAAAVTNAAELTTRRASATGREMSWCLIAVRGFRWSSVQSTIRLKSIAAVRAQTMQSKTRTSKRSDGRPFVATSKAPSANGSAKSVCEKRMRRRKRASPFSRRGAASLGCMAAALAVIGQKRFQSGARGGEDRSSVRKQQPLERHVEQLSQRTSHNLLIGAVLWWQERKSERLEIDECIADDDCSVIVLEMERDLARCRAFDRHRRQACADLFPCLYRDGFGAG